MEGFLPAYPAVIFIAILNGVRCLIQNGYFAGKLGLLPDKPDPDIDGMPGQWGVGGSKIIVHLSDERRFFIRRLSLDT